MKSCIRSNRSGTELRRTSPRTFKAWGEISTYPTTTTTFKTPEHRNDSIMPINSDLYRRHVDLDHRLRLS